MSDSNDRLRQHPDERFHPTLLHFQLGELAEKLRAEALPANRNHRQETLYRNGPLTVALFLFGQGASMPKHMAGGVVTIQVLDGRLTIVAEGQTHDLSAGSLLILAPNVPHDLLAIEPTRMLLTVCLNRT